MDQLDAVLTLLVTHGAAMVTGVVLGRWLVLRTLVVTEHDGHIAVERRHDDESEGP